MTYMNCNGKSINTAYDRFLCDDKWWLEKNQIETQSRSSIAIRIDHYIDLRLKVFP